jgi:hypothetical protein
MQILGRRKMLNGRNFECRLLPTAGEVQLGGVMRWNETVPGISGPFPGVAEIERLRLENEDVRDGYAKWEKEVVDTERKIDRPASFDLDALTKAGADRKALVRLLAITANKGGTEWWKELVRRRREALKSLARRMDTLETEAKEQAADVTFRSSFYTYFLGGGSSIGMKEPEPLDQQTGVSFVISGMHALANAYRVEAKRMSHFLRHYGQTDYGLVICVMRAIIWTKSTDHFESLARLLTDAFEAAGKREVFSADQLRKIWNRHGKRMLAIYVKLHDEREAEESAKSADVSNNFPPTPWPTREPKPHD